jgi:aconitate hydratase
MLNSFGTRTALTVGSRSFDIFSLAMLERAGFALGKLPYSMRVLLEMLLRTEDNRTVTAAQINALCQWDAHAVPSTEIAFMPARVILQDFTGVPAVVDLAAMREAMQRMGGNPERVNPLLPVELVIDHSVQVDEFGHAQALSLNSQIEFRRNRERYAFLRWGQAAFDNFQVVPPDTGIVHQVNLEYLARVVFTARDRNRPGSGSVLAYPDTLVGTDSHTTMINGLGVLGWGVGGIEAEAAMLGQPMPMLIPQVVGFRLRGTLREGATATDLVLTVTEMLRKKGVVGRFVEFFGPGLAALPLADRATIANMAPEYGATCGIFPVDEETLRYLRLSGRSEDQIQLVEVYCREQGLFASADASIPEPDFSEVLELDLARVQPSVAGPRRPQDRVPLGEVKKSFAAVLPSLIKAKTAVKPAANGGADPQIEHGSVVIAAITSCTNTSNPSVMLAAGLLAKKAVERGLETKPWVKTSLAPGSKVVTEYLNEAGLSPFLDKLRFQTVAYGCTTCIGNSGPLPAQVSQAIEDHDLVVCSVLSGNRNFEGRINPEVRANYLMSPPLVVAYALAGRVDIDFDREPVGQDRAGQPVFLKDLWPTSAEVSAAVARSLRPEMFKAAYEVVFEGDPSWRSLPIPSGATYAWDSASTYIKHPPYFESTPAVPGPVCDIIGARALAVLGDSITTDHISPAGSIKKESPAGRYLISVGVEPKDFNSYGARRGNHEVMVRGTFANTRIKNLLAPGTEGGVTRHLPGGEVMSIYDAAVRYAAQRVPLVVLAGKEYGSGSSRDWAAKGTRLLGVAAVIAESYERIHRSNLVGMGVVPLEFLPGDGVSRLGLSGEEIFDTVGLPQLLASGAAVPRQIGLRFRRPDGAIGDLPVRVRIDTPQEAAYYQHGGILPFVLRQLLQQGA